MTFTLYKTPTGWRWRLVARNGNVMADSGEGYRRRQDALAAIASLKRSVVRAVVIQESGGRSVLIQ